MNNSYKKKYLKYKKKYMSLKILNGGSHTSPYSIKDIRSVLTHQTNYTGTDLIFKNGVISKQNDLIEKLSTQHIDTPRQDTKQTPVPQPVPQRITTIKPVIPPIRPIPKPRIVNLLSQYVINSCGKTLQQNFLYDFFPVVFNSIILNEYIINNILSSEYILELIQKKNAKKIKNIDDWEMFIYYVNVLNYDLEEYILIFFNILICKNIELLNNKFLIFRMLSYKIYYDYKLKVVRDSKSIESFDEYNELDLLRYIGSKKIKVVTFFCDIIKSIFGILFNNTIMAIFTSWYWYGVNTNFILYFDDIHYSDYIDSRLYDNYKPTSAVLMVYSIYDNTKFYILNLIKCKDDYYLYESYYINKIIKYTWIDTHLIISKNKNYKTLIIYVIYTKV